jgi:DNA-directed RNA polymerase subunit RPC12/RpoP
MTEAQKTVLCVECRSTFTDAETEGYTECPKCGSQGMPALLTDMHTINITRHELRILTMWAANWAEHIKDSEKKFYAPNAIAGIASGIRAQLPEIGPLTLSEEFQEVADVFQKKVETSLGDFEPNLKH